MKLVLYDPAHPLYEAILKQKLRTPWLICSGAADDAWLRRELPDADALLALKLPSGARPLARRLKAVFFPGAGVMHQDARELPSGCRLCNVYEHDTPVAEFVMMAILMHVTQVREYAETFRRGDWAGNGRVGGEPHKEAFGATLGLIGYGHIGQAVAARARAFGMCVEAICTDPRARQNSIHVQPDFLGGPEDLDRLMRGADFLVIACPLNPSTYGLLGERELRMLNSSAVLINVSRAEIVEQQALFGVLRDRRIAGAALDVWYQYPCLRHETLHGSQLPFHELPNVLATPHLAAWTTGLLERRMARIAENLDRLALGEELERVVMVGNWRAAESGGD